MKTEIEIQNCLISELSNLLSEIELGSLTSSGALNYFSNILIDSGLDSRIVVKILEDKRFGKEGKEEALGIKIREGW